MKRFITLLLITLTTAAAAQTRPVPIVFKDTVGQLVFDSLVHDFAHIPATGNLTITRHFKYLGERPITIIRDWTTDPHFICDYPKEPLVKGNIYSYRVCFTFQYYAGRFNKYMGFYFSTGDTITFNFKGIVLPPRRPPCLLDRFLPDTSITEAIKMAYLGRITKEQLDSNSQLRYHIRALPEPPRTDTPLTGLQKQRQQFNLRAYLNLYKLVAYDNKNWYYAFGISAMQYLEQYTKEFASCYDGSNGFDRTDFFTWAEIAIKGLWVEHEKWDIPFDIHRFIQQLELNVKYSSPAIRAAIREFAKMLRTKNEWGNIEKWANDR